MLFKDWSNNSYTVTKNKLKLNFTLVSTNYNFHKLSF